MAAPHYRGLPPPTPPTPLRLEGLEGLGLLPPPLSDVALASALARAMALARVALPVLVVAVPCWVTCRASRVVHELATQSREQSVLTPPVYSGEGSACSRAEGSVLYVGREEEGVERA